MIDTKFTKKRVGKVPHAIPKTMMQKPRIKLDEKLAEISGTARIAFMCNESLCRRSVSLPCNCVIEYVFRISDKPKFLWLVIAALHEKISKNGKKKIPDNTIVMNREALARMYGPTLVSWMQLVDEPAAVAGAASAAVVPLPGGVVAAAAASSVGGAPADVPL
jgi:hypothetical protein